VIQDFRANRGAQGRPPLLLTTTGARTGRRRTTPMMYVPDGDGCCHRLQRRRPAHPAWDHNLGPQPGTTTWDHNLVAHLAVTVEVGAETYDATAVVLTGDERDRLVASIVERYRLFADHQAKVSRTIPEGAPERHG
jgi:deazaflavin-dependent oxidoreductase (nitroreductase family)